MVKYYTKIEDMPIYNWFKVMNGDYRFMLVKHSTKYDKNKAIEAFNLLYSDYIDTFGIGETYERVIELKKEISILQIEKTLTGDRFLNNFIRMAEIELNNLNKGTEKTNVNEVKVHLEKYLGFRLNEREVSVKEYYTYLNVMSKESKKAA